MKGIVYFQTIESILKQAEIIPDMKNIADFQTIESILKLIILFLERFSYFVFPDY